MTRKSTFINIYQESISKKEGNSKFRKNFSLLLYVHNWEIIQANISFQARLKILLASLKSKGCKCYWMMQYQQPCFKIMSSSRKNIVMNEFWQKEFRMESATF